MSPLSIKVIPSARVAGVALLLAVLSCMQSGCVIWEIRDEMRAVNASIGDVKTQLVTVQTQLDTVKSTLDTVNASLGDVNGQLVAVNGGLRGVDTSLAKTNNRLGSVEGGLGRIDTTNTSLSGLQDQLQLLQQISASMKGLDAHLVSLRKSLGGLNSLLPFVDIGGDALPPSSTPQAGDTVAATPAAGAAPAADATSTPAPAPTTGLPPAALFGPWLSQFPDRRTVLVLKGDGSFIRALVKSPEPTAAPEITTGTWKRDGSKLTLSWTVEVPAPQPAPGAAGSTTAPKPATAATPGAPTTPATVKETRTSEYDIASQTTRSLTLQSGGQILVFNRP